MNYEKRTVFYATKPASILVMDKSNVPLPSPQLTETVKARKESPLAQFSDKIGKIQIIEKEVKSSTASSHGFHCATCNASFTSSDAFLDHCNGKVHQKNLGVSLKVERVDEVDRVKARLQHLTQKRLAAETVIESKSTAHFEKKLDESQIEINKLKEERKSRKKQKRNQENDVIQEKETNEAEETDLFSSMGFKSFS